MILFSIFKEYLLIVCPRAEIQFFEKTKNIHFCISIFGALSCKIILVLHWPNMYIKEL